MSTTESSRLTFSVVLATRRRPEALADALERIACCDPMPLEVIVVDGDSQQSARDPAERAAASGSVPVRYAVSSEGLSRQRNRGVELARGDVVVFLDDDALASPDLFAALAGAYRNSGVIGASGRVIEAERHRFGGEHSPLRRILFPGKQGRMTAFGYPRRILDLEARHEVEWMHGCFMSALTDAARRVGHDERIGAPFRGEDEDFAYRLSRLGRLIYEPSARVHHLQLGVREPGRSQREFDRDIVLVRSYLFRKNFERTWLARAGFGALIAVLLVHRLINAEWDGARGVLDGAVRVWRTNETAGLIRPQ